MSTALLPIERIQEIWTTALQRHGRATARPVVSHLHEDRAPDQDDPEIAVGVVHAGWRLDPGPDGTRSGSWTRVDRRLPAYALEATATECALNAAERTKAQPGDAPATWEGSVLPALRLALDEHPETRGVEVSYRPHEGPGMLTATACLPGAWTTSKTIRLGTAALVQEDVETLAIYACGTHGNHLRNLAEQPQCPVCQAIAGWAPTCTRCRSGGSATYDPAKVRATFDGQPLVPMSAKDAELSIGYVPEQAKGPDGYRFSWRAEYLQVDHSRCSARISWGNQSPGWLADDEHRAAWDHARRLLAERKQAPPPGYTFKFDCDGDVEVERTDGRTMCVDDDDDELEMLVYARAAGRSIDVSDNAAPDLWTDHEPARQWAALLLGETAPHLRESEPNRACADRDDLPAGTRVRIVEHSGHETWKIVEGLTGRVMDLSDRGDPHWGIELDQPLVRDGKRPISWAPARVVDVLGQIGVGSQVVLQARQDCASRGYDGLSATVTRRLNDQYVSVRVATGEEIGWGVADLRPA